MAWLATIAAAAIGAGSQASAADKAKTTGLATAFEEKLKQPTPPYTPTAATAEAQAPKTGADLSNTFAVPPPALPQGQRLADVMGKVDSLSTTDLSKPGEPPPITGTGAFGQNLTQDQQGNSLATPQASGTGFTLDDAQNYAGLAQSAVGLANSFRSPQRAGVLPQMGQGTYTPTANVAIQRLQDLLKMRRGY